MSKSWIDSKKQDATLSKLFAARIESYKLGRWKGDKQVEAMLRQFYAYGFLDRNECYNVKLTHMPEQYDRRKKLMKKDIAEIKKLRAHGFSAKQIAGKFNVSLSTVYLWCNDEARIAYRKQSQKWREQHPIDKQIAAKRIKQSLAYKQKLREEGKL